MFVRSQAERNADVTAGTTGNPASRARQTLDAERVPEAARERRGWGFAHAYYTLLAVALALFLGLGVLAHGNQGLSRLDVPIAERLQSGHWPLYDWVLTHESDLGFYPGSVITVLVVFAGLLAAGLRLEALLGVGSTLLAGLAGGLIKQVVGRARPSGADIHVAGHVTGYSFPSGHVIQYTMLFGFCLYVVLVTWRRGAARAVAAAVLAMLILLVGPSRVYMGQHWPSDVLGAYLLAGGWLVVTIRMHLALKARLRRRTEL
jgi:membrane-associated phospholipid phosphatase